MATRPAGPASRHCNDPVGIASLVASLEELKPELVVLEATGGKAVRELSTTVAIEVLPL